MAYVTLEYYKGTFLGSPIEEAEFARLAMVASDVIDALVTRPINDDTDKDQLAKATAYQVEYIAAQGGIAAVTGAAESQKIVNEKLDDYSIVEERTEESQQRLPTVNGVPVSPLTLSTLRKMGLMSRWYFSGRGCRHGQ